MLDVGCGLGEHTILLTAPGLRRARHRLRAERDRAGPGERGGQGRRRALRGRRRDEPRAPTPGYDTILDSALFHVFGDDADRARYVASLHGAIRPGGVLHVLALSDAGRGFGPQVSEAQVRAAFADGWELEALDTTTYRGVVGEAHAEALGVPVGTIVDEPAWLARVRRR